MPSERKINAAQIYRKYGMLIILAVLFISSAIINPNFLKVQNLLNILKQISVVTIIACGQTMLIVSGMIDLSAGMVCSMCACFAAGTLAATGSVPLAFAVGIGLGMVVGWINGFLITKFQLQAFIATLAMTNVAKGITQIYTNGQAINGVEGLRFLGSGRFLGLPMPAVVMLIVVIVIAVLMRYTSLGLRTYSIGGNENASLASGINVHRTKRLIFTISGALVGLASVVLVARMMSGQPSVGEGYEFDAITATVVGGTSFTGGTGTVVGALIGSIVVGMINNILNLLGVSTQYQLIVKGLLIAGAVIVDIKTKSSKV